MDQLFFEIQHANPYMLFCKKDKKQKYIIIPRHIRYRQHLLNGEQERKGNICTICEKYHLKKKSEPSSLYYQSLRVILNVGYRRNSGEEEWEGDVQEREEGREG